MLSLLLHSYAVCDLKSWPALMIFGMLWENRLRTRGLWAAVKIKNHCLWQCERKWKECTERGNCNGNSKCRTLSWERPSWKEREREIEIPKYKKNSFWIYYMFSSNTATTWIEVHIRCAVFVSVRVGKWTCSRFFASVLIKGAVGWYINRSTIPLVSVVSTELQPIHSAADVPHSN